MIVARKRTAAVVLVLIVVVLFRRSVIIVVPAIVALVASIIAVDVWKKSRAVRRFRACWSDEGRDLLLVYSNSPNWQEYVERTWLPKWERRAVVLNWSERKHWKRAQPEVALFHAFAGPREFNPLAIVLPAQGRHVRVIRFWRAFRDFRHGKDLRRRAAEDELERHLADQKRA